MARKAQQHEGEGAGHHVVSITKKKKKRMHIYSQFTFYVQSKTLVQEMVKHSVGGLPHFN